MNALELTNLKKSFDGGRRNIISIDHFALESNQQLAIFGSSGSGKSTFLNLISGILRADSGEICVGQQVMPQNESKRDQFRTNHMGYVFQSFNLLQGYTVLENIMMAMHFGGQINKRFADTLISRVSLTDRANDKPHRLSVGQQQRVAIARALANRPQLMLADEPTGNLDETNRNEVLDLIHEMCEEHKASLLIISHDKDVIDRFERKCSFESINQV